MKTRNLFLSLFAFAALCACNKEAQPENQVLENDAYVTVSIVAPGSVSTRADDPANDGAASFIDGDGKENTVNTAMFIFFDNEGNFSQVSNVVPKFSAASSATSPFVEQVSEATILLKAQDIAPTKMLVVLNAPAGYDPSSSKLSDVIDEVLDCSSEESFVMTNSVYEEDGVHASDITPNIKNSAAEALANPVTVYVERVLAKVEVKDDSWIFKNSEGTEVTSVKLTVDAGIDIDGDGETTDDSKEYDVKPVILGYQIANRIDKSYLYKSTSGWSSDIKAWAFDAPDFRSYWATSPTTGITYTNPTFNSIPTVPIVKELYCQENTTSIEGNRTSLIVAAQFKTTADAEIPTFYKHAGDYYSAEGIKALAVVALKSLSKNSSSEKYDAGDILITSTSESGATVTAINGDDANNTAANAALATYFADLLEWENGKAYYYTNIKHFNNLYGVVRNHVYQLTINSIKGFGIPAGVGDVTVPDTPEDVEYENLAATINILKWRVVSQEVDLE